MNQPHSYILIGPPGSGKSTLAECLSQKLDALHIDIGSELRRAASEDTPVAQEINDTINHKKELVSDGIVYDVLRAALARVPADKGVIVDGAPRPASQIDEVLGLLADSGRPLACVIFIRLPESESVLRISRRFRCVRCGQALILGKDIDSPNDVCPVCGGPVSQRPDDTTEGVRKRYAIFQSVTLPVVKHFREAGLLLEADGLQGSAALCAYVREDLDKLTRV